ncbi:MAG TPA: hypothetical protein VFK05_22935 [Polyangiaceae bacterium]|nr:hypothetical protein [Polyangiaceae bacterium]
MPAQRIRVLAVCLATASVAAGCEKAETRSSGGAQSVAPLAIAPSSLSASDQPPSAPAPSAPAPKPLPQLDLDGDDDVVSDEAGAPPLGPGKFERVGRAPLALQRICDFAPLADALYAAHATRPLGLDGATISRFRPGDARPWSVAFDWNRSGEPSKGGGAGQGFLRVHALGGRLFVPDADPPYNGFGLSEPGTEGYVFVSTKEGEFAKARMPGHLPARAPDASGKAGAAVLPRAYHVIDVLSFRGNLYAATGAVPPGQRAWHGASPGALLVETELGARFTYAADYPRPYQDGTWRLTFLVRFRDRLYAGLQDYDQREPNDYVYFAPPRERALITQEDVHAVRVTEAGTAQTLRWYADSGKLYWIAWNSQGVALRVSSDGDSWALVALPRDVGVPTDIVRFRGALHVLTSRALLRLDDAGPSVLWRAPDKRSPFELDDSFCAAPLAVFQGELYAGGQRDGALYRFKPDI